MSARLDVVIRAEGGRAIGLGHLRRCFSIALGLEEAGARWRFACADPVAAAAVTDRVEPIRSRAWSSDDAAETVALCARNGASVVLVDSYDAGDDYLRALRTAGLRVAAMQDAPRVIPADLVINPALNAQPAAGCEARFLGGVHYMPLRPEFRTGGGAAREGLLITVGGSDETGLSMQLLAAASAMMPGTPLVCVAGPYFSNRGDLADAVTRTPLARLADSPASMAPLMRDARVAIAGAGQTLYELAACGTPAVAIEMAPNQHPQATALGEAGIIRRAGALGEPDLASHAAALAASLLADDEARTSMSARARALVDGRGATRVAAALMELVRAA